jgi:fatty-acyl-CoA synthase
MSPAVVPLASVETLSDFMISRLSALATAPAYILDDRTTTFEDLQRRSAELADALVARGFDHGDRLGILVSSGALILEALFAAAHLGVIVVPLNIRLRADDIQFILNDAQPRLLLVATHLETLAVGAAAAVPMVIVDEDSTASLADAFGTDVPHSIRIPEGSGVGDDPALILYTSGTTGRPKGCVLTQSSLNASTASMRDYRSLSPGERLLLALPLFHVAGLGLALSQLAAGGCIVFPTRAISIDALLRLLSTSGATEAALAPPHLPPLMDLQEREPQELSLRRMVVGGGMYDRAFLDRLTRTMGRNGSLDLLAGYGQTEAGNFVACLNRNEQLTNPGACGKALAHVEVSIRSPHGVPLPVGDTGELCIRGPSVMFGYWRQPDATALAITDAWLHTGDVMSVDSEGFLTFVARIKELIKTGGENVYPAEVENILRKHPSIAECCVAGIPDMQWGEVVKAFLVLAPNQHLDADELTRWCKSQMAGYKRPRQIAFVERIPRDGNGKVQRHLLIRPAS